MPSKSFEDLQVYRLSEELADAVWSIVVKWESFAKDTVGKQIVKAADSIEARTSRKEREEAAIKTTAAS